jgi:TPR repeat protein
MDSEDSDIEQLRRAAKEGNPPSIVALAKCFYYGMGVAG